MQYRVNNLLALIGTAAGAGAYVVLAFLPVQRSNERLCDELRGKQEFITRLEGMRATILRTEEELRLAQQYVDAWRDAVPAQSELSTLYGRIHAALKDSGAAVSRFEPMQPQPLATHTRIPVTVTGIGDFEQITRGLLRLEQLPATVWVDELRLTTPREDARRVQCEAKLVVFAGPVENSEEFDRSENR